MKFARCTHGLIEFTPSVSWRLPWMGLRDPSGTGPIGGCSPVTTVAELKCLMMALGVAGEESWLVVSADFCGVAVFSAWLFKASERGVERCTGLLELGVPACCRHSSQILPGDRGRPCQTAFPEIQMCPRPLGRYPCALDLASWLRGYLNMMGFKNEERSSLSFCSFLLPSCH